MLAGIWYDSMYGGSITAILLWAPGESAPVMVAIDGYEVTKQGRGHGAGFRRRVDQGTETQFLRSRTEYFISGYRWRHFGRSARQAD